LVEGVRLIKRHQRASQSNPAGGVVEREGPLSISNVRLFESREGR
jgi:large subunit ribosomal protein L24